MKFYLSVFVAAMSAMSAQASIKASSSMGQHVMSKARRLEENAADEENMQWVGDYSLKFQGCHRVFQWNEEVDEEEDVRLYSKRLVNFRLCPTDSCSATNAGGCDSGYGDYIVDMETYVNSYFEQSRKQLEESCENFRENNCACEDNGDDQFNEAYCQIQCYNNAGMDQCIEFVEEQEDEEQGFEFDVEEYLECAQLNVDNGGRRKLEDGNEEPQYFVGPYCSGQGGKIYMGLFTDDTCTNFYSDEDGGAEMFEQLTGMELPYSAASIVGEECFSCLEPNYDENDGNDDGEIEISEACQVAYQTAGKCEYSLPSGTTYSPENSACNYIDGIKIIREDGLVLVKPPHANAVATAFTVIFAMAFAAMGFYVWYLRTRLGIKSDSLL